MTVLWENGECPPRKRLCLSTSQSRRSDPPRTAPLHEANLHDSLMGADAVGGAAVRCSHDDCDSPITAISNLGNTCFLNSVLYTLRFAPAFMHNLHHLALDLRDYMSRHTLKCSSLGRGGKSWSSKDLPSLGCGTGGGDVTNVKMQIATDKLHQLYEALHTEEVKDHMEPYHPHIFLHSLRDVNPIFEGNQQHDAHELLVCLLDNIRETCDQLRAVVAQPATQQQQQPTSSSKQSSWSRHVRKSLNIGRPRPKVNGEEKKTKDTGLQNGDCCTNGMEYEEEHPSVGHNFISEHFEGVSLLKTTCLECEQVTERKETFCDICVPITTDLQLKEEPFNVNKLYQSALVTEEYLHDSNKYWCEQCLRYNEAKRCVKFETLPKLLTLQIKRFSSGFGSVVSKVNEHMPTPLTLGCFCESCQTSGTGHPIEQHQYHLYGVIMHLGATIASGHYVAYVKARDSSADYEACTRDRRKTASLSSGSKTSSSSATSKKKWFFRSSKNGSLTDTRGQYFRYSCRSSCRGADCCGVRLRTEESVGGTSEPVWLECDDESVRIISKKQLEEILAQKQPKNSALTPYLLFYARQ
ncbi:hypothetical protein AAG570_000806 [Ranatra chinensis]|uniref:USP domain-containing protein n=1 Tax=Ranatra chinensis TaxID=642074 RepID=A0ABD0ZF04_9HEMI